MSTALGTQVSVGAGVVHVAPRRVRQPGDILVVVAVTIHAEEMVGLVERDTPQEIMALMASTVKAEHHRTMLEAGRSPRDRIIEKRSRRDVDVAVLATTTTPVAPRLGSRKCKQPVGVKLTPRRRGIDLLDGARVVSVFFEYELQTRNFSCTLVDSAHDEVDCLLGNPRLPEDPNLAVEPPVRQVPSTADGVNAQAAHRLTSNIIDMLAKGVAGESLVFVPGHRQPPVGVKVKGTLLDEATTEVMNSIEGKI